MQGRRSGPRTAAPGPPEATQRRKRL
jgi:hypothetical protein